MGIFSKVTDTISGNSSRRNRYYDDEESQNSSSRHRRDRDQDTGSRSHHSRSRRSHPRSKSTLGDSGYGSASREREEESPHREPNRFDPDPNNKYRQGPRGTISGTLGSIELMRLRARRDREREEADAQEQQGHQRKNRGHTGPAAATKGSRHPTREERPRTTDRTHPKMLDLDFWHTRSPEERELMTKVFFCDMGRAYPRFTAIIDKAEKSGLLDTAIRIKFGSIPEYESRILMDNAETFDQWNADYPKLLEGDRRVGKWLYHEGLLSRSHEKTADEVLRRYKETFYSHSYKAGMTNFSEELEDCERERPFRAGDQLEDLERLQTRPLRRNYGPMHLFGRRYKR